jgi:hypothetical protein
MVGTLQADRVDASIYVDAGLRGSVQAAQEHLDACGCGLEYEDVTPGRDSTVRQQGSTCAP